MTLIPSEKDIEVRLNEFENSLQEMERLMNMMEGYNGVIGIECANEVRDIAIKTLNYLRPMAMRDTEKWVLFGRTSSGKSTLINSFLKQGYLPTGYGKMTDNYIEITGDSDEEPRVIYDGQIRRPSFLKTLMKTNDLSANPITKRCVKFICNSNNVELPSSGMTIIDTPGIDVESDVDQNVEALCKDTDTVVLVVDARGSLSLSDKNILKDFTSKLSITNIIVVYNFWDVVSIQNIASGGALKRKHLEVIEKFLHEELRLQNTDKNIFFLSAIEGFELMTGIQRAEDLQRSSRSEEYRKFVKCLKDGLRHSSMQRRYGHLKKIQESVFDAFIAYNVSRNSFINIMSDYMCDLGDFNTIVNDIIHKSFEQHYDDLLKTGLDLTKRYECQPTDSTIDTRLLITKDLEAIILQYFVNTLKLIKENLKEKLSSNLLCMNFLEEFYYPQYLTLSITADPSEYEGIAADFAEINKKTKVGTVVTAAVTTVVIGAGVATGGALFVALGPVSVGMASVGAVAVGSSAAGAASGGSSYGITRAFRFPFRFAWKDLEQNLKHLCEKSKICLIDSFKAFCEATDFGIPSVESPANISFSEIQ